MKYMHFYQAPNATAKRDESDALNDKKKSYPFKAAAYCLLNHLRATYGNEAIEDVVGTTCYHKTQVHTLIFYVPL